MAVITKIEAQKRKEDRVNIYVDEKFFMAIYKELVFTFNLKKGDNIGFITEDGRKGIMNIAGASGRYIDFKCKTQTIPQ